MQKKSYTIGSLIILLICAFVFVIVPVMSGGARQPEDPYIGSYDGKEIRYSQDSDFSNAVTNFANMLQSQGVTLDSNNQFYVYSYAFNATVAQTAYTMAVEKSGYEVPEQTVNRELAKNFVDVNGKYSDEVYRKYMADHPTELNKLRSDTKRMLTSTRYQGDLFGNDEYFGDQKIFGLKASEDELNFIASINNAKRGFNLVTFDMNKFPREEKAAFGKANSSKFVKYDMSVITCDDEATAKKVAGRLANSELTFEDAVSEYSSKIFSGTDGKLYSPLDYQIQSILGADANIKDVTGLKSGETSGIVVTQSGPEDARVTSYSIFRSNGDSEAPDFDDDSTLNSVFTYIYSREKSVLENYFFTKAANVLKADDVEAACADAEADYSVIDPIPLNYGNASIAEIVDTEVPGLRLAAENDNFWKTAFSMKKDEWSSPIVLGDNVILLQYTTDSESTAEDNYIALSEVRDIDSQVANKELMDSPKVESKLMEFVFSTMGY